MSAREHDMRVLQEEFAKVRADERAKILARFTREAVDACLWNDDYERAEFNLDDIVHNLHQLIEPAQPPAAGGGKQ